MCWGTDMKVDFFENDTAEVSAYQFDYGQKLEISGLELENEFEVHFQNGTGYPEIRKGTVDEKGVGIVPVPDVTLSLSADNVKAWVFVKAADSGTTIKTVNIRLIHREKPSDSPAVEDYPQIKLYADYVKENAEKVSAAEAVAERIKADAAAGLFNGKDGEQGPKGDKGEPGKDIIADSEFNADSNNAIANSAVTAKFNDVDTALLRKPNVYIINNQDELAELLINGKTPLMAFLNFTVEGTSVSEGTIWFFPENGKLSIIPDFDTYSGFIIEYFNQELGIRNYINAEQAQAMIDEALGTVESEIDSINAMIDESGVLE